MSDRGIMSRLNRLKETVFMHREEKKQRAIETANAEIEARILGNEVQSASKIGKGSFRKAPAGDPQTDFFVPSIYDVPLKDDVNLMDIAPFRLSKRHQNKAAVIKYHVKDAEIEISSGAKGMATIYDYDIVLMMISELTKRAEEWRKGNTPPPDHYFAPNVYEILKFCRRPTKGAAYEDVRSALSRLMSTKIEIVSEKDGMRRADGFNLIDGYTVLSKTKSGRISQVSIGIPNWIYDGVVRDTAPTVLTYNPDYFLLSSGIDKFLYRLARKAAGSTEAVYNLRNIHRNSGSQSSFKEFSRAMRKRVAQNDLPDYELSLVDGRNGASLKMTRREQ